MSISTHGTSNGCDLSSLVPFDYENEVYTKSLWFVEGVTDYYADLLLSRAGVATRDEYLRCTIVSNPIAANDAGTA